MFHAYIVLLLFPIIATADTSSSFSAVPSGYHKSFKTPLDRELIINFADKTLFGGVGSSDYNAQALGDVVSFFPPAPNPHSVKHTGNINFEYPLEIANDTIAVGDIYGYTTTVSNFSFYIDIIFVPPKSGSYKFQVDTNHGAGISFAIEDNRTYYTCDYNFVNHTQYKTRARYVPTAIPLIAGYQRSITNMHLQKHFPYRGSIRYHNMYGSPKVNITVIDEDGVYYDDISTFIYAGDADEEVCTSITPKTSTTTSYTTEGTHSAYTWHHDIYTDWDWLYGDTVQERFVVVTPTPAPTSSVASALLSSMLVSSSSASAFIQGVSSVSKSSAVSSSASSSAVSSSTVSPSAVLSSTTLPSASSQLQSESILMMETSTRSYNSEISYAVISSDVVHSDEPTWRGSSHTGPSSSVPFSICSNSEYMTLFTDSASSSNSSSMSNTVILQPSSLVSSSPFSSETRSSSLISPEQIYSDSSSVSSSSHISHSSHYSQFYGKNSSIINPYRSSKISSEMNSASITFTYTSTTPIRTSSGDDHNSRSHLSDHAEGSVDQGIKSQETSDNGNKYLHSYDTSNRGAAYPHWSSTLDDSHASSTRHSLFSETGITYTQVFSTTVTELCTSVTTTVDEANSHTSFVTLVYPTTVVHVVTETRCPSCSKPLLEGTDDASNSQTSHMKSTTREVVGAEFTKTPSIYVQGTLTSSALVSEPAKTVMIQSDNSIGPAFEISTLALVFALLCGTF